MSTIDPERPDRSDRVPARRRERPPDLPIITADLPDGTSIDRPGFWPYLLIGASALVLLTEIIAPHWLPEHLLLPVIETVAAIASVIGLIFGSLDSVYRSMN